MRVILSVVPFGSLLAAFVSLGTASSTSQIAPQGRIIFEGCRGYCSENADLFAFNLRTGDRTQLTRTRRSESEPAVSVNGAWLAYSRNDKPGAISRKHQLWLSRINGSRPVQLTPNGAESTSPSWFKNDVVYFTRRPLGGCYSIFKVTTSGGGAQPVFRPKGDESLFQPSVAADGRRMAYGSADCEVRLGCCDIDVVDSNGKKTDDLSKLPYLEPSGRPAWSPDGQMIAFESGYDSVVWVARRDGSDLRRLSPRALSASGAAWSPDGEWIAFDALPVRGNAPFATDLYIVRVDGTSLRRLTRTRNFSESSPAWTR